MVEWWRVTVHVCQGLRILGNHMTDIGRFALPAGSVRHVREWSRSGIGATPQRGHGDRGAAQARTWVARLWLPLDSREGHAYIFAADPHRPLAFNADGFCLPWGFHAPWVDTPWTHPLLAGTRAPCMAESYKPSWSSGANKLESQTAICRPLEIPGLPSGLFVFICPVLPVRSYSTSWSSLTYPCHKGPWRRREASPWSHGRFGKPDKLRQQQPARCPSTRWAFPRPRSHPGHTSVDPAGCIFHLRPVCSSDEFTVGPYSTATASAESDNGKR